MKLQLSNVESIEAKKEGPKSVGIKLARTDKDAFSMSFHLDKTELAAFIAGLQQIHKDMK